MLRKIQANEVEHCAKICAQCFSEYPIYSAFFKSKKNLTKKIFYLFWFRMYTRQSYTYISDDDNLVLSVKKPEDRERSVFPLVLNPRFIFPFFFHVGMHSLIRISRFSKMEEPYRKMYYHPETDWYIQTVCVRPEARKSNLFMASLASMDEGAPIYAETHLYKNALLYRMIGAEVCEHAAGKEYDYYFIRREAVEHPFTADSFAK